MQTKLLLMTQKCLRKRKFMMKKVNNCDIIKNKIIQMEDNRVKNKL